MKMIQRLLSIALVATVVYGANSATAEWTGFRGPDGQGVITTGTLPIEWSAETNVDWTITLPGVAWSSPVIVGDKVFLTTAVDDGDERRELRALALDKQTGKELWNVLLFEQVGKVQIHSKNSHASPTPLVEGDRVYVHFGPHGTACLTKSGEVVWKKSLDYKPQHGNGGSPALYKDLLIICCDGSNVQFVTALNKQTGDEAWKTERDTEPSRGFSFSTPLIINVNGTDQAICPGSETVFAYEPATGKEIWRVNYPKGYSVVPRPVFGGGLLFVCSGYDKAKLYAIDPTGTGDVTESHVRWTIDKGVPLNPSPIAVGNELYFVSDGGVASCVDIKTGEVHWQERLGGKFSASPVATKDRVYFQDEGGKAYVVAASTEYKLIAENEWTSDERTFASYAADGDSLYLRSESKLLKVSAK